MSSDKKRASVNFKSLFAAFGGGEKKTPQPEAPTTPQTPPQQHASPTTFVSPSTQNVDYDNVSSAELERLQQMFGALPASNNTPSAEDIAYRDRLAKRRAVQIPKNIAMEESNVAPSSPTSSPTLSPQQNIPAGRNSPPPITPDNSSPPTSGKKTYQGVGNPNYKPEKRRPSLMNTVKSIWSQLHTKTIDLNEIKQQQQTNIISAQEFTDQYQKELDSGHNVDLESMTRKYIASVEVAMLQLTKESVIYMKKPRGHFKERFAGTLVFTFTM